MVTLLQLQSAFDAGLSAWAQEYLCQDNLNLYDSPELKSLATQAIAGRQLRFLPAQVSESRKISGQALQVCLCEDSYPGWLPLEDIDLIELAETPYQAIALSTADIQSRLPAILNYTLTAMSQPNYYLWGGTVGPNYDCSGLMQAAFMANGIWLPRDAYQQEGFLQAIALDDLQPGDLIFFGTPEKATHVGLHLGDGQYIHSSGKAQGRNGIGVDVLSAEGDTVSQAYYQQLRGAGRVVACYSPQ
jgi:cell wall-associated NlpC family hydrolase